MNTTSQITLRVIFDWELTSVAGEFEDDFDFEAIHSEYQDAITADIQAVIPSAHVIFQEGGLMVILDEDEADRHIDWAGQLDGGEQRPGADFDVIAALARHDLTGE